MRSKSELYPVEVKSNRGRSKSLTTLIGSEKYSDIIHGIKLGNYNVGFADNIYTFPYFCSFLLKAFIAEME